MRFARTLRQAVWLVSATALLAPAIGFAQSNSFQSTYCTYYNSYTQYCEFFMGNSSLSIAQNGQVISNAVTEVNWAFVVNMNGCQNYSNGNPYACQPPQYPAPSVSVGTSISPLGTWGSATSGCGWGCALLQLTTQATQAGTYTEISNHSAYFPPSGDSPSGQTQQQQTLMPSIASISPGQIGASSLSTTITLTGAGFGSSPSISIPGFGNFTGNGSNTGTSATFTVDPFVNDTPVGPYEVTATVNGLTSNAAQLNVICAVPTNFQQAAWACQLSGNLQFVYTFSSSTGNAADIAGCLIAEGVFYSPFPPPSPPWPPGGAGYVDPTFNAQQVVNGMVYVDNNLPPVGSFVTPYSSSTFGATQAYSYNCNCAGTVYFPGYSGISVTRMVTSQQGPWVYVIQKSGGACGLNLPPQ